MWKVTWRHHTNTQRWEIHVCIKFPTKAQKHTSLVKNYTVRDFPHFPRTLECQSAMSPYFLSSSEWYLLPMQSTSSESQASMLQMVSCPSICSNWLPTHWRRKTTPQLLCEAPWGQVSFHIEKGILDFLSSFLDPAKAKVAWIWWFGSQQNLLKHADADSESFIKLSWGVSLSISLYIYIQRPFF